MRSRFEANQFKHFGHLPFVVLVGIASVVAVFFVDEDPPILGVYLVMIGVCGYDTYKCLRMPYVVYLDSPETLRFKSLVSETSVSPVDIKQIETEARGYYVRLSGPAHEITMFNGFDGLYEIVNWVKSENLTVDIRGL